MSATRCYLTEVMETLQRVCKLSGVFDLEVKDLHFVVWNRIKHETFRIPVTKNVHWLEDGFEALVETVEFYEEQEAKAARQRALKSSALAKLTTEEKKALGL